MFQPEGASTAPRSRGIVGRDPQRGSTPPRRRLQAFPEEEETRARHVLCTM